MSPPTRAELPEALENAARALPGEADGIRPANGDPGQLLAQLAPEAAATVLAWLLEHEPEAGDELAAAWAEAGPEGADALLRVPEAGLPKAARKALRRARHRLRSQGVEVPQPAPAAVVAKLPPLEDGLDRALVSALDPSGTRMAYLVRGHPSGGARLFELVLDETRGVVEFEVYNAGRSQVRSFVRDFTRRPKYPGVEVTAEACAALIAELAAAQSADRPLPRAFLEWRSKIAAPGPAARTPARLVREALPQPDDADAALEALAGRVRERDLGPWPPPVEVLQPVAGRLEELEKSPIVVSPARRLEQRDEILDAARDEIFGGDFGEITARRFEETAYVLWRQGREADARACLAAGRAFRERGGRDNPVARALLEAIFAPILARLAGEGAEEGESQPSLLVKPR